MIIFFSELKKNAIWWNYTSTKITSNHEEMENMKSFEHVGFIINNNKDYKKKIQKEIACNTAEAKQH